MDALRCADWSMDLETTSQEEEVSVPTGGLTLADAESLLERMGALEAHIARMEEHFDQELSRLANRILARKEEALAPFRKRLEHYREVCTEPLRTLAAANLPPRTKSLKLAHGTLSFRTKPARVEITSAEDALQWCKRHDRLECIRVKEELDRVLLRGLVKRGFQPDGVEVHEAEETFAITFPAPEDADEGGAA